ncbi:MAG: hydantoinase B/oxoprolinase family protein [Firmicutes bacterium]|nr:hydantoinase B/oxoprolinase family protein [Bacillota bacterium]
MATLSTSTVRFAARNDPVTFEVLRHRLWQINDEQGKTIIHVSGSPVASEGNDFNVALLTQDGEVAMVGPYIVAHVSAISEVVKSALRILGERHIRPGDMYLTNDPWLGAAHQNDVAVIQPVFWEGRLFAWTASVIHQVDVGGPRPGSWNPTARSVFDEAPRYRLLKVVRDGELQPEVVETYLTNSRLPDLVEMDLRAQIASANVARERLHELIRRYGLKAVIDAMADVLDYAQVLVARTLMRLPDGEWYGEDHIDHDGHRPGRFTVRCWARISGDRLELDFRESDPQSEGFINTTYAGALAGAYAALFPYLCPDIPWNAGVLRQVRVLVEEGTVHHARFPAPVGFGVVHATHCTTNATAQALGKCLASAREFQHWAMGGWSGSPFVYNVFGRNDRGEPFATMLLSSDLQGCGARAFADGYDVGGKLSAPRASVANIESIESRYPVLYLWRRRARDAGGAGRYRGGVSGEVAFTVHHAEAMEITPNTWGASVSATPGILGGYPGAGATPLLRRSTNLEALWQAGILPQQLAELAGGPEEVLPAKCTFTMRPGDVFVAVPHGGGGLGDPLRREPERVAEDVAEGLVSAEWAGRLYGVKLTAEGRVDVGATLALRKALRQERREGQIRRPMAVEAPPLAVEQAIPVGPVLRWQGFFYCAACRASVGPACDSFKAYAAWRRRPLTSAGPWVGRYQGEGAPAFELWEYACPRCGELWAVEEHLQEETEDWLDFVVLDDGSSAG